MKSMYKTDFNFSIKLRILRYDCYISKMLYIGPLVTKDAHEKSNLYPMKLEFLFIQERKSVLKEIKPCQLIEQLNFKNIQTQKQRTNCKCDKEALVISKFQEAKHDGSRNFSRTLSKMFRDFLDPIL